MTSATLPFSSFVNRKNVMRRAHFLAKQATGGSYSERLGVALKRVWSEARGLWLEEVKGLEAEKRAEALRQAKAENRFTARPAQRDDKPVAAEKMSNLGFDAEGYGYSASRRQDCHVYGDFAWSGF